MVRITVKVFRLLHDGTTPDRLPLATAIIYGKDRADVISKIIQNDHKYYFCVNKIFNLLAQTGGKQASLIRGGDREEIEYIVERWL